MKWYHKGNELKEAREFLVASYEDHNKSIYLFGAGNVGDKLFDTLRVYGCVKGFIDNKKAGITFKDVNVLSLEDFRELRIKAWILVAVGTDFEAEICSQIKECGFRHGEDFFMRGEFLERIFPIVSLYSYNKMFCELAQISVTERCSLRCKKCAHACYNTTAETQDLSFEEVKQGADRLFEGFGYVNDFVLIGGEPFLYNNLNRAISYIGGEYRDKINIFSITSNGTIIPDAETLRLCKDNDITLRISDYSEALPRLDSQYNRLKQKFNEYQIKYEFFKADSWMDYGLDGEPNHREDEENIRVFDSCKTPCREIRGNRFYYCVMARSVSDNLKLGIGQDEYFDMSGDISKEALLEFQLGYSEKGFLDMCDYCNGRAAKEYLIPVAEQVHI